MKKIIVPVDYSPTAKKALTVALDMAGQVKAKLEVLHVYHPHLDPAFPYTRIPSKAFFEEKEARLNAFIEEVVSGHESAGTIDLEPKVLAGVPIDTITERSKADFDLMVMGTTGERGILEKVFGSVSVAVARDARCPVLLIPEACDFTGFQKILYASNHDFGDQVILQRIFGLLADYQREEVHFVHVVTNERGDYEVQETITAPILVEQESTANFIVSDIRGPKVLPALTKYVEQQSIDLLIMATRHQSFLTGLFHHSKTREMAFATKIPLLIMHFQQ